VDLAPQTSVDLVVAVMQTTVEEHIRVVRVRMEETELQEEDVLRFGDRERTL
jgi:hypothetical protein